MCEFKSGIVFKNRVVLAPMYNDSHSALLESLGVADTSENAMRLFVRVELTPSDGNRATDPKTWKFNVDQDMLPEWYEEDPGKYEQEFRTAVEAWVEKNTVNMVGRSWTAMKNDEKGTYYLLNGTDGRCKFGENNNYSTSELRKKVNESDLAADLKAEFGDRLVPTSMNLLALDGLKDYGVVEGDLLGIFTLDMFRECRENIPNVDDFCWTSTPNSTPSGTGDHCVRCVRSGGDVDYCGCDYDLGCAPVFDSSILNL